MTQQKPIGLLLTLAMLILGSSQHVPARPPAVSVDLAVTRVQMPSASRAGDNSAATQCTTCHHSELLTSVDRLTTDPSPDLRPAWSPSGMRIAYYSGRSGNDDIWAINVDGTGEAQLTYDPASDRRPAWSPDGTTIVFDSDRAGSRDIWLMNADGSDLRQLTTTPGEEMFASFSPDGSQILFFGYQGGRNDIWAMDLYGGDLRRLTSNLADQNQQQCTFACHTPAWSPDGTKIAFHADRHDKRDIWVMDADGSNPRQITAGNLNNYLPSWTPDGRIVFLAERPIGQTIRTDIRVIDADGSNEITLFEEVAHGGPFVWSPDGTRIAMHSQRGTPGNFDIFVATLGVPAEEEAPMATEAPTTPQEATERMGEEAPIQKESTSPGAVVPRLRLVGTVAMVAGLTLLVLLVGLLAVIFGFRRD